MVNEKILDLTKDADDEGAETPSVSKSLDGQNVPTNPVQYTKIHCTACNDHLGSALSDHDNRFVHPLLKVLICKECYEFYTSGDFEKEEDGSEKFCRWCGQGGQVLCCSKCEYVFCTSCIRNNLGRQKLSDIKSNDDWICFSCDRSQIDELRNHCAEVMKYADKELSRTPKLIANHKAMKTDYSKCCLKSNDTHQNKKTGNKGRRNANYHPYTINKENLLENAASVNKLPTASTKKLTRKPALMTSSQLNITSNSEKMSHQNGILSNEHVKPRFELVPPHPALKVNSNLKVALLNQPNVSIVRNDHGTTPDNKSQKPKNKSQQGRLQKATSNLYNGQQYIKIKKSFYVKTMRSIERINSDLSYDLLQLRKNMSTDSGGLEDSVGSHNKLQGMLQKIIQSLSRLQKELVESKSGIASKKIIPSRVLKKVTFNIADEDDGDEVKIITK